MATINENEANRSAKSEERERRPVSQPLKYTSLSLLIRAFRSSRRAFSLSLSLCLSWFSFTLTTPMCVRDGNAFPHLRPRVFHITAVFAVRKMPPMRVMMGRGKRGGYIVTRKKRRAAKLLSLSPLRGAFRVIRTYSRLCVRVYAVSMDIRARIFRALLESSLQ